MERNFLSVHDADPIAKIKLLLYPFLPFRTFIYLKPIFLSDLKSWNEHEILPIIWCWLESANFSKPNIDGELEIPSALRSLHRE